jgi:hypothetical protein
MVVLQVRVAVEEPMTSRSSSMNEVAAAEMTALAAGAGPPENTIATGRM